jgi:hypothetical protein
MLLAKEHPVPKETYQGYDSGHKDDGLRKEIHETHSRVQQAAAISERRQEGIPLGVKDEKYDRKGR